MIYYIIFMSYAFDKRISNVREPTQYGLVVVFLDILCVPDIQNKTHLCLPFILE